MTLWECNTCRGRFMDPLPDGFAYYHACPWPEPTKSGPLTPRPNFVDENLDLDLVTLTARPKSPGLGRREIAGAELDSYLETLGRSPAPPANPGLLTRAAAFIAAPFVRLFYA